MYYQSIMHVTRNVSGAAEAAEIIHDHGAGSYEALVWEGGGRTLAAVADGGLDDPWMEVAVIRLDVDPPIQIESITFAWIESLDRKIGHLRSCETTEFDMGRTSLPLDRAGEDRRADFRCGCCGEWFTSTVAEQKKFDQDEGYGICGSCDNRYDDWRNK